LPESKIVQVGGDVVGQLVAVCQDGDDLVEQLRKRAAYIGVSYGLLDELTGLGEGGRRKVPRTGSHEATHMASMLRIAEALGVRALFYVDPKLVAKVSPSWEKRDGTTVHARRPPSLGQAQLKRVLKPVAAEMGRRRAAAFLRATTPA
jgi:hypothetical protein